MISKKLGLDEKKNATKGVSNVKKALNFGCGEQVINKNYRWNPLDRFGHNVIEENYVWDNMDMLNFGNIKWNLNEFPYPIKDNTYDYINASFILEHLIDLSKVLTELVRISKPNAFIYIKVPHWHSYSAYMNVEHIHSFHRLAFDDLHLQFPVKAVEVEDYPSVAGRFIPFRQFFSNYIGGLIRYINAKFQVIK